jgi:hypothetical protein
MGQLDSTCRAPPRPCFTGTFALLKPANREKNSRSECPVVTVLRPQTNRPLPGPQLANGGVRPPPRDGGDRDRDVLNPPPTQPPPPPPWPPASGHSRAKCPTLLHVLQTSPPPGCRPTDGLCVARVTLILYPSSLCPSPIANTRCNASSWRIVTNPKRSGTS